MGRRFLPALFGAERKDATLMRATAVQTFAYGRPYLSDWSFERAIRDAYERVVWVYRGVDAIAGNAAGLEIQLRAGHPLTGKPIANHPLLPLLNVKANMWESAEAFQYRLWSQYILNKRGAFVEVAYNRGGDVAGLYLLPPQWTNPIPDPDIYVSGFRVQVPGGAAPVDIPAYIPPGQPGAGRPKVLWIRKPHPLDPYSGVTPLESAGITIDIDFYARLFNRAFLQNDGRPGGVLAVKGDLDPQDAEALRRKFSQGPSGAGRTAVVEADQLSWVDTSATHRDAQYVEGRNQGQQEILIALGTPLSILGWAADRTYENAGAEMLVFWRETMLNHLRIVQGGFNPLLADPIEFAPGPGGVWIPQLNTTPVANEAFIVYDTSSVAVLKRDEQDQMNEDMKQVAGLLMSPDEFRIKWGRDPYDVPGSRALWALSTMVAAIPASEEDKAALLPPAPPPTIVHTTGPPGSTPQLGPGNKPGLPVSPKPAALPAGKSVLSDLAATVPSGVMVALYPPPDVQAALSIPNGEDPADLHVTLAFLGKAGSVDADLLRQVVSTFATTMPALEARVSGYGRFDQDEEHVIYASIDAPDLPEFRQRLVAALNAAGIQESQSHGFTPHLSLAHGGADDPDPDMPPKLSWTFQAITVAIGADQRSYRLRGETKVVEAVSRPSSRWVETSGAR